MHLHQTRMHSAQSLDGHHIMLGLSSSCLLCVFPPACLTTAAITRGLGISIHSKDGHQGANQQRGKRRVVLLRCHTLHSIVSGGRHLLA